MKIVFFVTETCILVVFSSFFAQTAAKCPTTALIDPCKCVYYVPNVSFIVCGGNDHYELRNIFVSLSSGALNDDEKHFTVFYFNNTVINELVTNVFYDITFDSIRIENAYNLTHINSLAFIPNSFQLKPLSIYDTPIGGNVTETNSLFDVINTMVNVDYVHISNTSLTAIPANSFSLLNKLNLLYFVDNAYLKSIENYAFYDLNSLTHLLLNNNSIEHFSEHSLSFRNRNNNITLDIDIGSIENLTTKSFSSSTFASINRQYELNLVGNSELKYLDETIFKPVFANGNRIVIFYPSLECDCRMFWLYANRAQYQNLMYDPLCTDGQPVFAERKNYTDCNV